MLAHSPEPLTGRELAARVIADHGIDGDARGDPPRDQRPARARAGPAARCLGQVRSAQVRRARCLDRAQRTDDGHCRRRRPSISRRVRPSQCQRLSEVVGADALRRRDRPPAATADRRFAASQVRELFDLPDAPRPDPDTPAPVRFLPEFDNLLLSHADRRHVIPDGETPWLDAIGAGRHVGNVLIDGMLRAIWWIEREGRRRATLVVAAARPPDPVRADRAPRRGEAARGLLKRNRRPTRGLELEPGSRAGGQGPGSRAGVKGRGQPGQGPGQGRPAPTASANGQRQRPAPTANGQGQRARPRPRARAQARPCRSPRARRSA